MKVFVAGKIMEKPRFFWDIMEIYGNILGYQFLGRWLKGKIVTGNHGIHMALHVFITYGDLLKIFQTFPANQSIREKCGLYQKTCITFNAM